MNKTDKMTPANALLMYIEALQYLYSINNSLREIEPHLLAEDLEYIADLDATQTREEVMATLFLETDDNGRFFFC